LLLLLLLLLSIHAAAQTQLANHYHCVQIKHELCRPSIQLLCAWSHCA
jgi:hypothetical protein